LYFPRLLIFGDVVQQERFHPKFTSGRGMYGLELFEELWRQSAEDVELRSLAL
jgi:hypothetical protein